MSRSDEDSGKLVSILKRKVRPLCQKRQRRMRGIAQKREPAVFVCPSACDTMAEEPPEISRLNPGKPASHRLGKIGESRPERGRVALVRPALSRPGAAFLNRNHVAQLPPPQRIAHHMPPRAKKDLDSGIRVVPFDECAPGNMAGEKRLFVTAKLRSQDRVQTIGCNHELSCDGATRIERKVGARGRCCDRKRSFAEAKPGARGLSTFGQGSNQIGPMHKPKACPRGREFGLHQQTAPPVSKLKCARPVSGHGNVERGKHTRAIRADLQPRSDFGQSGRLFEDFDRSPKPSQSACSSQPRNASANNGNSLPAWGHGN